MAVARQVAKLFCVSDMGLRERLLKGVFLEKKQQCESVLSTFLYDAFLVSFLWSCHSGVIDRKSQINSHRAISGQPER